MFIFGIFGEMPPGRSSLTFITDSKKFQFVTRNVHLWPFSVKCHHVSYKSSFHLQIHKKGSDSCLKCSFLAFSVKCHDVNQSLISLKIHKKMSFCNSESPLLAFFSEMPPHQWSLAFIPDPHNNARF